ncbi:MULTISPECIES: glycosyltransferase family 2 protein [unclassified Chitinophaga]|uniref:glycosyltransferase family 2 protein n=1 Tax=unclassified Chitinophaga TaxID=2619133 RepID=UPI00300FCCE0
MGSTITVITVVYNDCTHIEETIKSIVNQTYKEIEFIIIDGASVDGTVDIIKKYERSIDYWVSEKDKGIYDAMNKGIAVATGAYTIFMNSGDTFYNEHVLADIFNQPEIQQELPDIIYGDTYIRHRPYLVLKKADQVPVSDNAMPFCHQSVFIITSHLKKYHFNLSYRIIGDRELITRLYLDKCKYRYINQAISIIEGDGFSNRSRLAYQLEENRMLLDFKLITKGKARINEKKAWIKDLLSNLVPTKVLQLKRRYKT